MVQLRDHQRYKGGVTVESEASGSIAKLSILMPQGTEGPARPLRAPAQWTDCVHIAVPFAEALFIAYHKNVEGTARAAFAAATNFFGFLKEDGRSAIKLEEFSEELVDRYIVHLTVSLGEGTRRHYYGTFRAIIASLKTIPAYAKLLPPDLRLRRNPWSGARGDGVSRKGIPIVELTKIELACLKEINVALARHRAGGLLIRQGRSNPPPTWGAATTLAQTVSTIAREMNGYLPTIEKADAHHPALGRGVRDAGGLAEVWSYLHLSSRTVIPFIVLLCIKTAFNSQTTITIRQDCVRESPLLIGDAEIFGSDRRHRLLGKKNRSRISQYRTYPASDRSIDNPINLIKAVRKLTARIRWASVPHDANKLFIFPKTGTSQVGGFQVRDQSLLGHNLKKFVAENELHPFTLAQIRPTISEMVDILYHGDIIARQSILNHQSYETTEMHYTSDASKERGKERLAQHQNRRDRWVATRGKSDPRQSGKGGATRAATDGYDCLDPYDSPIEGEKPGRLCQAWGSCPMCPLAAVNPRDPYSLARIVQLEASIESAKSVVNASRWIGFWLPALQAIRTIWLPLYSDRTVWAAAEDMRLPPLDIIE
ncbi:hypothetical protein [Aureimonas sp. Leaf454]|uniref:hypothetical protein n=1 Tax=Aureimonas sp. Leaf454 TaxID=1736381 RepID=UPI0012E37B5D|nr:hypothetical protein [Aureimonas sp. Leaf454]